MNELIEKAQSSESPREALALYEKALEGDLTQDERIVALRGVAEFYDDEDRFERAHEAYDRLNALLEDVRHHDRVEVLICQADMAARDADVKRVVQGYERSLTLMEEMHHPASPQVMALIDTYIEALDEAEADDEREKVRALQVERVQLAPLEEMVEFYEPAPIRSTRAVAARPKGLAEAALFPGYGNDALGISVMFTEMPVSDDTLFDRLSDEEQLLARGMILESSDPEKRLLFLKQRSAMTWFQKLLHVAQDDEGSVLVTATWPEVFSARSDFDMREVMEKCVLSTKLQEHDFEADPFDGLDFSISIPEGLMLATRIGETCIFNRTGRIGPGIKSMPAFVFGASTAAAPMEESARENFALSRLRKDHPQASDIQLNALTIANRPALEIRAKDQSDDELDVYLALIFDEHRYWIALLHTEAGDEETTKNVMQSVRDLKVG